MAVAAERLAPMNTEALFRAYSAFVARFVVRLGIARHEVEDVVQDVFVIVHRAGGYQPGPARPTTWLAEIAIRVASSRRRSAKRNATNADDELDSLRTDAPGPLRNAEAHEALERVQAALDGLDMDRRSVFVLYELEGESCDSIAAGLGIPVGTVYSRLHNARRQFMQAYGIEEDAEKNAQVSP
jgi:RNA polymerase sigma-70 factor (ECF subfamily)